MSFEEILNNTIIPSNLNDEEKQNRYKSLKEYISQNIPDRLYKYRSCCDNHISAFYKDQIWVSTADVMNDGFDARMYYDKDKVIESVREQTSKNKIINFLETAKTNDSVRANISKLPTGVDALNNLIIPTEVLSVLMEPSREKLLSYIENELDHYYSTSQNVSKFCSLSETISSASMWGQYSDNESGFAIEYDFKNAKSLYKLANGKMVNCISYPVIYGADRFTVPTNFIEYMLQSNIFYQIVCKNGGFSNRFNQDFNNVFKECPDELMLTKISLHKSNEWKYEKEWRAFYSILPSDFEYLTTKSSAFIKKPSALYLGRRISEANEKLLRLLASEKCIPVYKMKLDDSSPTYELKYE